MNTASSIDKVDIIGYKIDTFYVNVTIFIAIIIIIVVLIISIRNSKSKEKQEPYVVYTITAKKYCSQCGGLGRGLCSECTNCGYCLNADGTGECVSGNANGPFNGDNCFDYEYTSPQYYTGVYPDYWYYPYGWYSDGWWDIDGFWHFYTERDRTLRENNTKKNS